MKIDLMSQKCVLPAVAKDANDCPQGYSFKGNLFGQAGHCVSDSNDCQNMAQQVRENFCSMPGMLCPVNEAE